MLIGFGDLSLHLFCPLLMAISYSFERSFINDFIKKNKKNDPESDEDVQFAILLDMIMFFAEFTSIIPLLFQKYFTGESGKNTHEHLMKNTRKKFSWELILFIISISIFDFLQGILLFKIRSENKKFSAIIFTKFLVIVIIMFISMKILNYSYHKHHMLGLSIIGVGSIIFTASEFSFCKSKKEDIIFCIDNNPLLSTKNILFWIFTFNTSFLTAFQETCEKKFMENYFYSPFFILTIEGFSGIIMSSIAMGYFLFTNQFSFGEIQGFKLIFLTYISLFFFNMFRVLTNYFYSPCHRSIADTFGTIFYWALSVFIKNEGKKSEGEITFIIVSILSFIIILIGVIIFNEIIELLFCGFSINTKRMIKNREIEEQKDYSKIDQPEIPFK